MNRLIRWLLAAALCLALPLGALASELTGCTVTADAVAGAPGETVTVAVRIGDNPGFTNFSVSLDYDREALTLTGIEAVTGGGQWAVNQGEALVVFAAADPVEEDGILFTATFRVSEGFSGETRVTPAVGYIRNNGAVFSLFEEIRADIIPGAVTCAMAGDVSGDGIVEYNDVMLAYKAFLGQALSPEQMAAVDRNGNGTVEEEEYQAIYQIYMGG